MLGLLTPEKLLLDFDNMLCLFRIGLLRQISAISLCIFFIIYYLPYLFILFSSKECWEMSFQHSTIPLCNDYVICGGIGRIGYFRALVDTLCSCQSLSKISLLFLGTFRYKILPPLIFVLLRVCTKPTISIFVIFAPYFSLCHKWWDLLLHGKSRCSRLDFCVGFWWCWMMIALVYLLFRLHGM